MSYDLDYTYQTSEGVLTDSFNITYNVSGMFYAVCPRGIKHVDSMNGEDSLKILIDLYKDLVMNREEMLQHEPDNGWGSWENTVRCINKMVMLVSINPEGYWEVV